MRPQLERSSGPNLEPLDLATAAPLDVDQLLTRSLHDGDFAHMLVNIFETQFELTLVQLRSALGSGDLEQTTLLAHRLKGSCANAGAVPLTELFAQLEEQASHGAGSVAGSLELINREWQRLSAYLPRVREEITARTGT